MNAASRRLGRLVRRLGKVSLVVLTGATVSALLGIVAALAKQQALALVGANLALLFVVVALASQQARRPSAQRSTGMQRQPRQEPALDMLRMQYTLQDRMADVEDTLAQVLHHRLEIAGRTGHQQHAAMLQLFAAHTSEAPVLLEEDDPTPDQILRALHLVRSLRPGRVLIVDLGAGSVWIAADLAEHGGSLDVLEDAGRAAALSAALPVGGVGTLHTSAQRVPDVPHALLPWHDLDPAGTTYDLIIINATGRRMRPALPVLPMLPAHLGPDGRVAVIDDDGRLAETWSGTSGWHTDPSTNGEVLVLRRPNAPSDGRSTLPARE